jgi:hypothetical protein
MTAAAENLSLEPQMNEEEICVHPTTGSPELPGVSFAQVCTWSGSSAVFSCVLMVVLVSTGHISCECTILLCIHLYRGIHLGAVTACIEGTARETKLFLRKCEVERVPHVAPHPESICEHCPLSYKYEVKVKIMIFKGNNMA